MPVKSRAQFKWLAQNRPDLLDKWQREQRRKYSTLPPRVKKKKRRK